MRSDEMKTYEIHDYATGRTIGTVEMTPAQYLAYESAAQQPEGLIALGDLDGDIKGVPGDASPGVTVYLEPAERTPDAASR